MLPAGKKWAKCGHGMQLMEQWNAISFQDFAQRFEKSLFTRSFFRNFGPNGNVHHGTGLTAC